MLPLSSLLFVVVWVILAPTFTSGSHRCLDRILFPPAAVGGGRGEDASLYSPNGIFDPC